MCKIRILLGIGFNFASFVGHVSRPARKKNHNMKVGNKSYEGVEEFEYLGTIITNQFSIREEINRLKSGNTFYQAVRNLLSSSLLFKNIKFKIYRIVVVPFV